jgi:hypothetical protein
MLLTSSYDASVKLYQFPIFWPAEMIRKNKATGTVLQGERETNKEDTTIVITNDNNSEEDLSREFGSQIKIARELTEIEIYSDDLNGWDE